MIVTPAFVFLHLHKSGGTFVNRFVLRFFPDARLIGYHLPRTLLPPEYSELPIFGLVRNPWDYYVSWYSFQALRAAPNPLYRVASENGRLGFAATVTNLINLSEDSTRLDRVMAELPDEFTNRGINLTKRCLQSFAGSSRGFYSWMFDRMYGDRGGISFGRMESLSCDLAQFLASTGVALGAEERAYLENQSPVNVSGHAPYPELYDDELRDLIARKDAYVIERFAYCFLVTNEAQLVSR